MPLEPLLARVHSQGSHDVAFDEQFLRPLRVSRAGTRDSRKQTHQGYMRPSHRGRLPVSLLTLRVRQ